MVYINFSVGVKASGAKLQLNIVVLVCDECTTRLGYVSSLTPIGFRESDSVWGPTKQ